MIKTQELILSFTVNVTPLNINLIKRLAGTSMITKSPEEVELGDSIDVEFVLEGEFTEYAVQMAMLFNSGCTNQPTIKVVRNEFN